MTIECRTTFLGGLIQREPRVVEPGHKDINVVGLMTRIGAVKQVVIVESPDHLRVQMGVTVPDSISPSRSSGFRFPDLVYTREEINEANIVCESDMDLLMAGRCRHYSWRP